MSIPQSVDDSTPNQPNHAQDSTSATPSDLAQRLAERCGQAKQRGDHWQCLCPAHDDSNPSLSITATQDRILVKCHAGCTAEAIMSALGMKVKDLYPTNTKPKNNQRRIVKVYDYVDAAGHLVHQTVRYEPKKFLQRRPDPARSGKYLWNLKGITPVLYHLPGVLEALQRGDTIYLAEGEKDVGTLRALGLVATCNPMGAKYWKTDYSETLRGAHVVILPDNDTPGEECVRKLTSSLAGIAASLKVVRLPGVPPKGDVTDWVQAGGTREQLEALVAAEEPYRAPAAEDDDINAQQEAFEQAMADAPPPEAPDPLVDPLQVAQELLERLKTMAEEEKHDAVLDKLSILITLDDIAWMGLLPKLKAAVPSLDKNALKSVRHTHRQQRADQAKAKAKAAAQGPRIHQAPQAVSVPLRLNKDDSVKACLLNVMQVLTKDPRCSGLLKYDELIANATLQRCPLWERATADPWEVREVQDRDHSECNNWLQAAYGLYAQTAMVAEGMHTVARRSPYHVIREYLEQLKWDQTARLDKVFVTYCQAEDTEYVQAVGRITLLGAVKRAYEPGCQFDTMAILQGLQGWQKSKFWRTLASDKWFLDTPIDIRTKDAGEKFRGVWFYEFADLSSLKNREAEAIKAFITSLDDRYRPAYGRVSVPHPRRNIFVGTTNKETFFTDETGNRRFIPVRVGGMCDIEGLIRDRDQLWAEAVARYKAQEPVYLSGHLEQLAMLEQAERLEPDDWEAPILTYVNAMKRDPAIKAMVPDLPWRDKITGLELMEKALHIRDKKDQTLTVTHRIGKIMRTLDWTRKKIRDDYVEGIPAWGYERTTPSGGGNTTGSSWPGQEEDCPEGTGREQDVPDAHGSGTASGTPDDPANMRSVPDVPDVPDNRAPIEEKTPTLDDTEGRDTGRRDKGASKISTKNVAEHGEHQEHRNNGPVTGGNAVPDVLQDQEQTVSSPHRVPVPPPPCPHERLEVQDGENICLDCGEVIDVWVF